jgi:RNase H-like domain found in reverse transcriptase
VYRLQTVYPTVRRYFRPLNVLLCKDTPPQLGPLPPASVAAFTELRDRLLSPPVLALPRTEGRLCLDTNASDGQLGCLPTTRPTCGKPLPLGFWSRTLNSAERNYSATEKECLAIVWAVTHLRPYLEGTEFTVITDHHALRCVMNLSDAQGRSALGVLSSRNSRSKWNNTPMWPITQPMPFHVFRTKRYPHTPLKRKSPAVRSLMKSLKNLNSRQLWKKLHQTRLRKYRSYIWTTSLRASVWTRRLDGTAPLVSTTQRGTTTDTASWPDGHPPGKLRYIFHTRSDVTVRTPSSYPLYRHGVRNPYRGFLRGGKAFIRARLRVSGCRERIFGRFDYCRAGFHSPAGHGSDLSIG